MEEDIEATVALSLIFCLTTISDQNPTNFVPKRRPKSDHFFTKKETICWADPEVGQKTWKHGENAPKLPKNLQIFRLAAERVDFFLEY